MNETITPNYELAYEDYKKGLKYKEIAEKYGVTISAVKSWASRYWKKGCNQKESQPQKVATKKKGGQPGNKNATGPPGNKNAEKHGLFSKHLPEDTLSIIQEMPTDPLDVLWDQIQIAYAAIIRSQKIMYVKDINDYTKRIVMEGSSMSGDTEARNYQEAWDKQANFLSAQARAQKTLESMINRYDDLLHKNWEQTSEEQRLRILAMKAKLPGEDTGVADDGFLDALKGMVYEVWEE